MEALQKLIRSLRAQGLNLEVWQIGTDIAVYTNDLEIIKGSTDFVIDCLENPRLIESYTH